MAGGLIRSYILHILNAGGGVLGNGAVKLIKGTNYKKLTYVESTVLIGTTEGITSYCRRIEEIVNYLVVADGGLGNLLAYAVASAPEFALELLYHIMFIMSIARSDGSVQRYGTNVTLFSKNSSI